MFRFIFSLAFSFYVFVLYFLSHCKSQLTVI